VMTEEDAIAMVKAGCSLETFQQRMLSSEFDAEQDAWHVYNAAYSPEQRPIRAWLRSADFSSRVRAIEWEDPLGVFFDACEEGDEEYVSRAGKEDPALLDKGCEYNDTTVLHAVCCGGLMRFVPELVSRFGDVDSKDGDGQTPLFWACRGGHVAAFEYLVSVGADVRAVSRLEATMLHAACEGGNPAIVKALLDMGLDVNARDTYDTTPLHKANEKAGMDVVKLLVEHGADLNPPESMLLETPLHCASRRGDVAMVQYLHEVGAVLEEPGSLSPLCAALSCGHMGVVEYLVSAGASVGNVRENSEDIIYQVLACDSAPAMQFLMEQGGVIVTEELIESLVRVSNRVSAVLRHVLLYHEESDAFVSLLPDGFLGGFASLSEWREHELRG
jgi:hypothetical protein